MAKDFSVDDTLYRAQAKKLVGQLKIDEKVFIKQQAALYARLMSKVTPPHPGGKFPKMTGAAYQQGSKHANLSQGLAAIVGDMGTHFVIKSKGYLQFLHDLTKTTRNIRRTLTNGAGVKYVVDVDEINYDSLSRALKFDWQQRRPSSGRARNKDQGSNDPRIGRWTARNRMWITLEIWDKILTAKYENIGMSKAALASAAVKLGLRNPPPYIKRHMAGSGTRVTFAKKGTEITIRAAAPGLPHAIRAEPRVKKFRTIAMVKGLKKKVRAIAKKSGFQVR